MSDILGAISAAYMLVEEAATQVKTMASLPIEKLGANKTTALDPYPYEENKEDFYAALCAAHPNPTSREDWRTGICALAYLVVVMAWPETEARQIRITWENLAENADKADNEVQWLDALERTKEKTNANESTTTHLTILKNARKNGWKPKNQNIDPVIAEMNTKYAWIDAEAGIYRIRNRDFIPTDKFHCAHANQFTTDSGNRPITISKKWLSDKNRRQHAGIVTRPNEPEITKDGCLNDWGGFAVQPIAGDITPFIDLNTYLFGGETFPLTWLGHLVQKPEIKMYPSLVIWSTEEGVGKNLFFEVVQNLFPPQHATVISQSEVEDDFSGWIPGTVFAIADEIKAARSDKVRDKLKLWSTATTLRTHDKGQPKRVVPNLLNLVFLSNHADGMHLTDNDRRFFIWEVTAKPLPQQMINDFIKWRNTGGLSHLLYYLQNIDLKGFDPKGRAPITQAKVDMVEASRSDLERWCKDVVTGAISLGQEVTSAEKLLASFCREYPNLKQHPSVSYVGKTIARMGARTRKNQVRLTSGRKIRAIAINRPEYWETQNEAAWRDEFERRWDIASGATENASGQQMQVRLATSQ